MFWSVTPSIETESNDYKWIYKLPKMNPIPAQIIVMKNTINWKIYHKMHAIINASSFTFVHSSVNLVADIARCGTSLESAMVSTFHNLELKHQESFFIYLELIFT